jgi:hypothetical protein
MKRKTIIISVIIILAALIIFFVAAIKINYSQNELFKQSLDSKDLQGMYDSVFFQSPAIGGRPYIGNEKAPLTLISVIDFQAGLDKTFYWEKMQWLKDSYVDNNTARIYYKYIITKDELLGRKGEFIKALASYCHDEQRMNDTLDFNNALFDAKEEDGQALIQNIYLFADNFSLDKPEFEGCMNSTPKALVQDVVETMKFRIRSPSLIIGIDGKDNEEILGNPSYETMTKRIRLKQIKVGI